MARFSRCPGLFKPFTVVSQSTHSRSRHGYLRLHWDHEPASLARVGGVAWWDCGVGGQKCCVWVILYYDATVHCRIPHDAPTIPELGSVHGKRGCVCVCVCVWVGVMIFIEMFTTLLTSFNQNANLISDKTLTTSMYTVQSTTLRHT